MDDVPADLAAARGQRVDVRSYLVEGVSGTGKASVWELNRLCRRLT